MKSRVLITVPRSGFPPPCEGRVLVPDSAVAGISGDVDARRRGLRDDGEV